MTVRVALIVGSLRKGSYSRAIGMALKALAEPGLEIEPVEIGGLPLYDPDLETDNPPPASLGESSIWWFNPAKAEALRAAGAIR